MKNNIKDITGQTFNYLTATKRLPTFLKGKRTVTLWKFICICGKEKIAESADVKSGNIKSCGCKTKELQRNAKIKPEGEAAFNSLYKQYKRVAKERNYSFDLSRETFLKLIKENCYYCEKEPSQIKKSKLSYLKYNGIDRVDNTVGYLEKNVVSCCKECNTKKSGITKEMIKKLYKWFEKNE